MRSLTELPGLKYSTFARTIHGISLVILFNRISGVWPMVSRILFFMFILFSLGANVINIKLLALSTNCCEGSLCG
jgi:hypothetical protein